MFGKAFTFYRQLDAMDCGPSCLRMVAAHYGRQYSLQFLRERSYIDREGVSLRGIAEAAEQIGFTTVAVKMPFDSDDPEAAALTHAPLPAIVHWKQRHFVVVYRFRKKHVWIADPAKGLLKLSQREFLDGWQSDGEEGIALLLEPTPEFYAEEGEQIKRTSWRHLFGYLRPYRQLVWQLLIGLIVGGVLQLLFPFLTQAVVDIGIENQDLHFIWLILLAQLMLFLGQTSVQFIQSWILLHIGTRVNISLISDFLRKLMRLPIAFFDTKMIGDLLQRIGDQRRIEQLLTTSSLSVLFSAFNLVLFGFVLGWYHRGILLIFVVASLLYLGWIFLFLRRRAVVDHQRFEQLAENQRALIELIYGMQEIKLQNSERRHRWQWTHIQARLFRANVRSLRLSQYQDAGAQFFSQLKDILITFVAASAVIRGEMTLGMLLAVQFIVGQLNAPLSQLINFIRTAQDAKISLERLGEIQEMEEEGNAADRAGAYLPPSGGDLRIEGLSFRYNPLAEWALREIDLVIPQGKVTAIVGTSGSGKTTLVKLLLGFYRAEEGSIHLGSTPLHQAPTRWWREQCGAVMQDGYLFSETIARNIAESEDQIDREKLLQAVEIANVRPFIESLPLGFNTLVGEKGSPISQGQRQRLLIARAVYKDPAFLFFDEATNALDARNEKIIQEHLEKFFQGRTVVVVAHRLSTVRHADQIVVLEQGRLIEKGTHQELTAKKGAYYELVRNQLELGA